MKDSTNMHLMQLPINSKLCSACWTRGSFGDTQTEMQRLTSRPS